MAGLSDSRRHLGNRLGNPWANAARRSELTDTQSGPARDPDDDEGDRTLANIVLLVGFVALVGGGIWLANAMVDWRKADECVASGRRNCLQVEVPPR